MKAAILAAIAALGLVASPGSFAARTPLLAPRTPYYVTRQQLEATIMVDGADIHIGRYDIHTDVYQLACKGRGRDGGGRYHLWRCVAHSTNTGKPFVLHVTTYARTGGGWAWIWHL
jgi:hypothetical protein